MFLCQIEVSITQRVNRVIRGVDFFQEKQRAK